MTAGNTISIVMDTLFTTQPTNKGNIMLTDEEILERMEWKREQQEEDARAADYEYAMRNDIDFFLTNSSFQDYVDARYKFLKELRHFDWHDTPENLL